MAINGIGAAGYLVAGYGARKEQQNASGKNFAEQEKADGESFQCL